MSIGNSSHQWKARKVGPVGTVKWHHFSLRGNTKAARCGVALAGSGLPKVRGRLQPASQASDLGPRAFPAAAH